MDEPTVTQEMLRLKRMMRKLFGQMFNERTDLARARALERQYLECKARLSELEAARGKEER